VIGPKRHGTRVEPRRRGYLWQFVRGTLFAQFLLFATWNHSGYSYLSWVGAARSFTALMAVAGIALIISYVAMFRIAYVALGYPGLLAASVLLAVLMLAGSQLGIIKLDELTRHVEFWLFITASILSIGIGWAKYQQRFSGQRDVLKAPP
jgi:hypothetical protein